jgi:ceramide glucosyltransferase
LIVQLVFALMFGALAVIGIGYTLFAAWVVTRLSAAPAEPVAAEPVTLLKPLYGREPRLADNLASFLDQDWTAPIQMVAGFQRLNDPAIATVKDLDAPIDLVIDSESHGANAKIGNLLNMVPRAKHDLLVISDSDMAVPRDYLRGIAAAMGEPGVGAVSCLYCGRGDRGDWSRIAAAQISYQFLPSVLVGVRLGLASPCMGSTIAIRRSVLEAIGGLKRFADDLADDYAIGEAVRAFGYRVAIPPMVLTHGCIERDFEEVWRHELRWAATILRIDTLGAIGSIVTYPVVWAVITMLFTPLTGLIVLALALAARLFLKTRVDALVGASSAPAWVLPLRDTLSFLVFLRAFFVRSVDWRGARLTMRSKGRIAAAPEYQFR